MTDFSNILAVWYEFSKRDLPWRDTKDPYRIWLSEIILQQTKVEQGKPYYYKFIKEFPTVHDLANANLDDVLKVWQGLGYYSRARNLHSAANQIINEFNGDFPNTYSELKKLKGVGDYTASAIASFCFGETTPVLDGNVYRFISRLYGIETQINTPKAIKEFKAILHDLIDPAKPDVFNQAIMEFGAVHCKPKKALCDSCVFESKCFAKANDKVYDFPKKAKSKKSKDRYFNYLVYVSSKDTYLTQRVENDIWSNLYEFPLIESKEVFFKEDVSKVNEVSKTYKHILSHQNIWAKFYLVRELPKTISSNKIKKQDISKYPVHRLLDKFLTDTDWI